MKLRASSNPSIIVSTSSSSPSRLSAGLLSVVVGLSSLGALTTLTGCPENPYAADTWIKKLDDQHESERAVTELEHLGDPKAIPALATAWEHQGKPVRLLQVVIDLAKPLTKEEAAAKFYTGLPNGRPSSWAKAMPMLQKALAEIDTLNPRSLDSAIKAADALGDAQTPEGMDALITVMNSKMDPKGQRVRLAAVLALGKYKDPKAVAALSNVLRADSKDQEPAIFAAAVNALADIHSPEAVPVLIETMYKLPALFGQIRRALVAAGPRVGDSLRKIIRGEDATINALLKDKKIDPYCGDKGDEPPDQCQPTSAKDFYPVVILGDLYDPKSVPDLLTALARPALPVYFHDDQPSPNTQYNAIFDSLRKIGSAEGADKIKALWDDAKTDLSVRVLAIGAYPFLARDQSAVADLGKIAEDNKADDTLRMEAATAFARLANEASDIAVLQRLAEKYAKASADKQKEADAAKPAFDAVKAEFDAGKKAFDDAKAKSLRAASDKNLSIDDIKKATAAVDEAKKAFDALKDKFKDASVKYKPIESAAKDYRAFGRSFQAHIARIEIAMHCKEDAACYAGTLTADHSTGTLSKKADEIAARLTSYIPDLASWTLEEKRDLVGAQIERAMLELGKLGSKASGQTDALLAAAKSDDRIVRQSVLLTLPKIAALPCKSCEEKLVAAIKAGEGKTTLGELNVETTILKNYFAWAGTK